MSQMMGQGKTSEKQLNKVVFKLLSMKEIDNHPEKEFRMMIIQNNEDDTGSLKKNGEDAGNVCQRPRRTKEQMNRGEKIHQKESIAE